MRLKRKTEIEKVADEIIAQLNRRWRRPLNETAATFEFIRRLKFKTEGDDARCAAVLRSALAEKWTSFSAMSNSPACARRSSCASAS